MLIDEIKKESKRMAYDAIVYRIAASPEFGCNQFESKEVKE